MARIFEVKGGERTQGALLNTVLQLLTSEGSSGFAEGLRLLVDEAMLQDRSEKASVAKESPCSFWPRCVSKSL